ncbi:MAG: cysteine--tRNA ligase [Candidatus Tectomicrobia bacterium]|uniref:Cysteine--tRNA ligase n=1 Tax=Tectimicrobiota bacterium TaxID=2528274 RepID=A0A932CMY2_UNCTE|nr:cysteine--tRNA ligase [Candidatus Tectomicrobia bacterium]
MALRIYNTLTQRKEPFTPQREGKVGMYVCGITVYDLCHVGHARAFVVFDVIYRYLKYRGYEVTYVRNFTDIDDKIIARAQREETPWEEIVERYIQRFHEDMTALGVERPQVEPRVTDHIPEIIELVQGLIAQGYAYPVGGDIYYAVERFPSYGRLSGRNLQELQAGARIEVDERKVNPLDFALWKASKPGEPAWDSPWGKGRPGWHIECSAMSMKYLGESFDIHGGGQDLIFPHHENEIAQSEAYTGRPFARYWIHNGFINVNQEKMSKSLGNFFTIAEILKRYHPEVIRFFLLSKHYRSPIDFAPQHVEQSRRGLNELYRLRRRIEELFKEGGTAVPGGMVAEGLSEEEQGLREELPLWRGRFEEAMDNDFNTAQVLGYLFQWGKRLGQLLEGGKANGRPAALSLLREAWEEILGMGHVLGLFSIATAAYPLEEGQGAGFAWADLVAAVEHGEGEICQWRTPEALGRLKERIEQRGDARRRKDWAEADRIREELAREGIALEDTPAGTAIRFRE